MPETVLPGPICNANDVTEAVSIHTGRVYDSCRDKDCIEDLRVYLTPASQALADQALSLKSAAAELLYVYIDVESLPFNKGFYTVDATYFYRVTANAYTGVARPGQIEGLAIFEKRAILFGSEGNTKVFSSNAAEGALDSQMLPGSNNPVAVVEAVDPIVLSIRTTETCATALPCGSSPDIPKSLLDVFGGEINFSTTGKNIYVTLGQFSVIRLERDSQLLIPAFDFTLPERECDNSCSDASPCDLFESIEFPVADFSPPSSYEGPAPCGCE
ncbi:MAG: hypothetical protein IJP23_01290 [Oscillospiraceae bacterium]|nr:hypothetical protein [Oscillospiraceae bacterium]